MQIYSISTDEQGRELTKHGDPAFPCAGYDEYFSKFILGEVPWHWHEEIEIVSVCEGTTKVEYLGGDAVLTAGEGLFINANMLHRLTNAGPSECRIINFVLKPEFLGGGGGARIFRNYIAPICTNRSLGAYRFSPGVPWQKQALEQMKGAFRAYEEGAFGFEMTVLAKLVEFWRLICVNDAELMNGGAVKSADEQRTMKILSFVERHYRSSVSVSDLASAAGISESECYRLFARTLKCTPVAYLLKYRLRAASDRLLTGEESVLTIALETGFNSSAYFTKCFKERYGQTPREWRRSEGAGGK